VTPENRAVVVLTAAIFPLCVLCLYVADPFFKRDCGMFLEDRTSDGRRDGGGIERAQRVTASYTLICHTLPGVTVRRDRKAWPYVITTC
jgi:hypothetical protein